MEVLKTFPDDSVDCVVTSPPYWAVRDYGTEEQIGLEEHPQEYIDKIVAVMKECKRVLKPTGTIFLNVGDSFYTKSGSGQGSNFLDRHKQLSEGRDTLKKAHTQTRGKFKSNWLQSKQRLLIPHRIAIAMQDELGLICRNDITWVKQYANWKTKKSAGTAMPTSVQDRLNTHSEMLFMFVKNPKYYFNLDGIRIRHNWADKDSRFINGPTKGGKTLSGQYSMQCGGAYHPKGKNPGDCIMFPLEPSSENHFAMFPKTLPDFCIRCGCPENGIVLDPFAGGGTTLYMAKRLDRKYIGIELNEEYVVLINKKLSQENITGFFDTQAEPSVQSLNKDLTDFQKENPKSASQTSLNPDIIRNPATQEINNEKGETKQ